MSPHNTIARSGGAMYGPTMSRTFSTKRGSVAQRLAELTPDEREVLREAAPIIDRITRT